MSLSFAPHQVRHILCHEVPSRTVYERGEIEGFLNAAAEFAGATHAALTLLIYGEVPVTVYDMTKAAATDLKRMDGEIDELLEKPKRGADKQKDDLMTKVHGAWSEFRKAHCDAQADGARSGSQSGYLWLLEAFVITKDRIEQLKKCLPEEQQ